MSTRTFALIFGIVFLLIGIAGFIPGLVTDPHVRHPSLAVDSGYGQLLGLFPVNILHNIVHLLFGVWGIIAYGSTARAVSYARWVAILYAILMVAGFIPGLNTLFGLVPLFGNDIWLHLLLAAVAAYFGWVHRDAKTDATVH